MFSLTTEIIKKVLQITRNKKKKHSKIFMLAKRKLNSSETLLSQDLEISHEEIKTIVNEEQNYRMLQENIKDMKGSDELNKKGRQKKKLKQQHYE